MDATPRVNGQHMIKFVNRRVILVGRCEEQTQGEADVIIKTSDKRSISVIKQDPSVSYGPVVEIVGEVTAQGSLREISHVNFGEKFDLDAYNEMVELANGTFKEMFMDSTV